MSRLKFKDHEYNLKRLIELRGSSPLYQEGEVEDLETGESIDIKDIDNLRDTYFKELMPRDKLERDIKREIKLDRIKELEKKYSEDRITKVELYDLIKYKKPDHFEIGYDQFFFLNIGKEKPKEITPSDYGRFIMLLDFISYKNTLAHSNGKKVKEELLLEKLEFKNTRTFNNFISKLSKHGLLAKSGHGDKRFIHINPVYATHSDFKLYPEITTTFIKDIAPIANNFKDLIEDTETLEILKPYLDLVNYNFTQWKLNPDEHYRVIEDVAVGKGIYLLYKDDKIIYIGKSNNIKLRVSQHKKDKDFDNVKIILFKNDADIDLYEPYLINKYKPMLNKDFIRDESSMILPQIEGV